MAAQPMAGAPFRKVDERRLHDGHVISLAVATFAGPDGTTFQRDVVHHPGAVAVVAISDADEVFLVRQYRASVDQYLLEIPAGKRDVEGEDPEATARRELEEEVGQRATSMTELAEFLNAPGFCDERSHVYLATGLEPVESRAQGIEEEHMTIESVPLGDVMGMIARREVTDAASIIGLTLALRHLGR